MGATYPSMRLMDIMEYRMATEDLWDQSGCGVTPPTHAVSMALCVCVRSSVRSRRGVVPCVRSHRTLYTQCYNFATLRVCTVL